MEILDLAMIIGIIILVGGSQIQEYIKGKRGEKTEKEPSRIDEFCEKHYRKIWIIFVIILLISVVYKFGELPTYIAVDEAGGAYDAYSIAEYGVDRYLNSYPVYLINFGGGQSALCCYLTVICIKLFGCNMISYRLPFLIMYIITVIVSYLLVSSTKHKKTALLFTFLVITCAWNIVNARQALDCNLYAGMLMINLFLMNRARKNYQYIIAGISVGITLYTYCLSWVTMPIFLAVWAVYMLYIKKIKIRQLILFAIPIAILAMPLIYFLLLNYGIVSRTQFGIFTVPKLFEFRSNEIAISNIWTKGLTTLKVIFTEKNTIYPMYVPLFIIGYMIAIKQTINSIKRKEYNITAIMVITFTTILIGLLVASVPTANKANMLYIPILYFVTIAILEVFKKSKTLFVLCIILICISFIHFEYKYYTDYAYHINSARYEDNGFYEISKKIEENIQTAKMTKKACLLETEPYIYQILATNMSPYEYDETAEVEQRGVSRKVTKAGNYQYYTVEYHFDRFLKEAFKQPADEIIIVTDICMQMVKAKGIDLEPYQQVKYNNLYVLVHKNSNINLESVIKQK